MCHDDATLGAAGTAPQEEVPRLDLGPPMFTVDGPDGNLLIDIADQWPREPPGMRPAALGLTGVRPLPARAERA